MVSKSGEQNTNRLPFFLFSTLTQIEPKVIIDGKGPVSSARLGFKTLCWFQGLVQEVECGVVNHQGIRK